MDKLIRSSTELKKLSSYSGSVEQFKSSKQIVDTCRKHGLIADIKTSLKIWTSSNKDLYATHLSALTKEFLFQHRELKVWSRFAAHADCRKVQLIFWEIGLAKSYGLFSDDEELKYDPLLADSKRVTLSDLYDVYRIKFNFSGSLQSFKRQITRTYGSYAEYCLKKGYDLNTTKWDSEETALRVARKLGSVEEIQRRSPSLLKYLEDRKLTKKAFDEGAA